MLDASSSASTITPLTKSLSSADMGGLSQKFIGAVKDEWQLYSDRAEDYTIGEPIGFGASSIVYAAKYRHANDHTAKPIPCALKVLDLDSLPPRSLQLLQRETTLMSLSKHPNVLRVRGSWMDGHKLYIALRLMNRGSAADVMRYGWPGGMEEEVVKCILRQALKGLNYLHINGFIHRDIKAANLLVDDDGTVLLGDLGVAADLTEDSHHSSSSSSHQKGFSITTPSSLSQPQPSTSGSGEKQPVAFKSAEPAVPPRPRIGKRKSFVGTPCWMAPELIQGKQYDASADIWSFAITALELTQGRPPRSRESPQRVLLRTLQEDPPTLEREGGTYKYTRAFKDVVDSCLVKDPSKRPTAEQLLQTPFFRSAKKKSYLVGAILKDLPPLTQRQERRVVAQMQSPNYIDSWDFATTIHSPPTSVYRGRALEELVAAEDRELSEAIFEMEGDAGLPSSKSSKGAPLTRESTNESEVEQQDQGLSSSPATSDSQFSGSLTRSRTASTHETSTAPSSVAISSPLSSNEQDTPSPLSHSAQVPKTEEVINSSPSQLTPKRQMSHADSDSDLRKREKSKTRESSPHGLWRKFKSNLKRPSSPGDARSGELEAQTSKGHEKGKLSERFGSIGRAGSFKEANKTGHGK